MITHVLPDVQPTIAFNGVRVINVREEAGDMIFTIEVKKDKVNPYKWSSLNEFWADSKKLFMLIQASDHEPRHYQNVNFNEDTNQIE